MALNVTSFNLNVVVSGMTSGQANFSDENIFDSSGLNFGSIFQLPNVVLIKKIEIGVFLVGWTASLSASGEQRINPFYNLEIFLGANQINSVFDSINSSAANQVSPIETNIISPNISLLGPYTVLQLTQYFPEKNIEVIAKTIYLRKLSMIAAKDNSVTSANVFLNLNVYWENIC